LVSGPGGAAYTDRQVFSYHIYCQPTDPEGDPRNVIECDGENFLEYEVALRDARRLGGGGLLTEFGATGNRTESIRAINWLLDAADNFLQGWAYWQFKYYADLTTSGTGEGFYNKDGVLEENKVKALSRTYPQAVAGIPIYIEFHPENGKFELDYHINPSIVLPTEIYLNEKYYYPKGYTVSVTPTNTATWNSPAPNTLHIIPVFGARNNTLVTVTIVAK